MTHRPRQGSLRTPDGARIDYVIMGRGTRRLVYLPGAGDGIATASEAVARVAVWMRRKAKYFQVLYLSRRAPLPEGFGVREQAADVIWAMEQLGWGPAVVEGQSAGGPVAIRVAHLRPDLAPVLVLSSTTAFLDEATRGRCAGWVKLVEQGRWDEFHDALARNYWPASQLRLFQSFKHLLTDMASPLEPARMRRLLEGLLCMDTREEVAQLTTPTLVVGGADDTIFPQHLLRETAAMIPDSRLVLHPGLGHSHELENPRHDELVAAFARLHRRRLEPVGDCVA